MCDNTEHKIKYHEEIKFIVQTIFWLVESEGL
jgi:hypothetical protein